MEEEQPRGNEEELSLVKDVLGTYTTTYKSSNSNRSGNIANGCRLIDGTTLYPGDEFSTYQTVSPFSEKNGYYMAGSYLNGKVVDSSAAVSARFLPPFTMPFCYPSWM